MSRELDRCNRDVARLMRKRDREQDDLADIDADIAKLMEKRAQQLNLVNELNADIADKQTECSTIPE